MRISTFVITKGVKDLCLEDKAFNDFMYASLHRFQCQNWGETCEEDALLNNTALETGERIIAVYEPPVFKHYRIWIIADTADEEGKRIVTVLFPSEY